MITLAAAVAALFTWACWLDDRDEKHPTYHPRHAKEA